MKKLLLLLTSALVLSSLSSCTTVQDENDAALDDAMDEQAVLERSLAAERGCSS